MTARADDVDEEIDPCESEREKDKKK